MVVVSTAQHDCTTDIVIKMQCHGCVCFCLALCDLPLFTTIDVIVGDDALRGAEVVLRQEKTTCFIPTHGEQIHRDTITLLQGYGYDVQEVGGYDQLIVRPVAG